MNTQEQIVKGNVAVIITNVDGDEKHPLVGTIQTLNDMKGKFNGYFFCRELDKTKQN